MRTINNGLAIFDSIDERGHWAGGAGRLHGRCTAARVQACAGGDRAVSVRWCVVVVAHVRTQVRRRRWATGWSSLRCGWLRILSSVASSAAARSSLDCGAGCRACGRRASRCASRPRAQRALSKLSSTGCTSGSQSRFVCSVMSCLVRLRCASPSSDRVAFKSCWQMCAAGRRSGRESRRSADWRGQGCA